MKLNEVPQHDPSIEVAEMLQRCLPGKLNHFRGVRMLRENGREFAVDCGEVCELGTQTIHYVAIAAILFFVHTTKHKNMRQLFSPKLQDMIENSKILVEDATALLAETHTEYTAPELAAGEAGVFFMPPAIGLGSPDIIASFSLILSYQNQVRLFRYSFVDSASSTAAWLEELETQGDLNPDSGRFLLK